MSVSEGPNRRGASASARLFRDRFLKSTSADRYRAAIIGALIALMSAACGEHEPTLVEIQRMGNSLRRSAALDHFDRIHGRPARSAVPENRRFEEELALKYGDTAKEPLPDDLESRRALERIALEDPQPDTRLLALRLWLALPQPPADDRFLMQVLVSDPSFASVGREAAFAYQQLWGDQGIRILFHRFEMCGVDAELTAACYRIPTGLAAVPSLSMSLLLDARSASHKAPNTAKFALVLIYNLFQADPSLREDPRAQSWLDAVIASNDSIVIRAQAALLRRGKL